MTELIDRRDLDWLLFEWLKVDALPGSPDLAGQERETFEAVLNLAWRLSERDILPHFKASDSREPALADGAVTLLPAVANAVRAVAEAGLFGAPFPAGLGGLGLPRSIYLAALGLLKAGSIGTASYIMLTVANARLIAAFGSAAQIEAFARPQVAGSTLGTMCLSEVQAGSSLADIRTRAVPDGSDELGDRYRISGDKMWISAGDHDITRDIVHLVLAKVPGPDGHMVEGTRGISLFVVPKWLPSGKRNDVAVTGLNHKMGYRGLSNCVLRFGDGGGAVGWMIGSPGQGLTQMFQMMNEARVGVGLGAAMLALRAYRLSLRYAQERMQGRPLDQRRDAAAPPAPIIAHADVRRMLLTQKAYAEGAIALVLYCARLIDEEGNGPTAQHRGTAADILALLTPIAKTWPSEWGLAANDIAIQIHGGYGYTRDFDVEQLWRDNRLNAIHEGTTGIQALDLLGRKVLRERGASVAALGRRIADTVGRAAGHAGTDALAPMLERHWRGLTDSIDMLLARPDEAASLADATPFQSAFGHIVVAWLWLDIAALCAQALADGSARDRNHALGKLRAARWFFETELPRAALWLDQVREARDTARAMPVEEF
ncbi:acyl-CoA dehydrogenase [Sphingobium sp. 22B]|uniref:acyl-CoA dehydrogenase n=1 Tax=unclassified Sphingobium TaxID=2611147 RepID=UPI00078031C2|nr:MULTISPECIES: acyl-CoA dehydrogenase [unclassified Sphingobium]KXU29422.1 acyl-CoA dehydrogenase [Sphingobium sp. AM]KYC30849.1 acyl-CoA dehydrogenase [Sphingobium sp. 22B]OAP29383.1 acyl-CoA dehydrogenase [Sphingobium sp. 20006FA]